MKALSRLKGGNGGPAPFAPRPQPWWRRHFGLIVFVVALAGLSALTGVSFKPKLKVYTAGEIAEHDIAADQDLLVEERSSTKEKMEHLARSQPPYFDLNSAAGDRLVKRVQQVFAQINAAGGEEQESVRWQVAENVNAEISESTFQTLRNNEVQQLVELRVAPLIAQRLADGVVADVRSLAQHKNGIVVREPDAGRETLREDLSSIRDLPALREEIDDLLRNRLKKSLKVRKAVSELVEPLLSPSLVINPGATQTRIGEIMQNVEPVFYHIRRGEVVVRQGERVTPQAQLKLQAIFSRDSDRFDFHRAAGCFILALIFSAGMFFSPLIPKPLNPPNRDVLLLSFVMLFFIAPARFVHVIEAPLIDRLPFLAQDVALTAFPAAGAAGTIALFLSPAMSLSASMLMSFLACRMTDAGLDMFLFYFLTSWLMVVVIKRVQTAAEIAKSIPPFFVGLLAVWAGQFLLHWKPGMSAAVSAAPAVVGGLASLLFIFALSPLIETLFRYTSRFRLMELMSLEQPLLRELMVNAPGTYHHSLIVAGMAEAGARGVGANALLCKVAAFYHDIGKIKNPEYFIENQHGGKNKHDKLAPSMSALILINHVKKGVELAQEHKLGPEIIDAVRQHHGSSLIGYFHNKAVEQAGAKNPPEPVREEDYRYPGPKPQTKEAGILLLADAVEASSRVLAEPTPTRIKAHIKTIIGKIMDSGQLDESDLTFKDLNVLSENFHKVLTGIFHHRIEYPDQTKSSGVTAETTGRPLKATLALTEPPKKPDREAA